MSFVPELTNEYFKTISKQVNQFQRMPNSSTLISFPKQHSLGYIK